MFHITDLPVCPGLGCGREWEPDADEDSLSGLCPTCFGLYRVGVVRQLEAGIVPVEDRPDEGPVVGGRCCGACRRWFRAYGDGAVCGACLDTVEFGRELVGELLDVG
jgi:hypothetical protein